MPHGDYDIHQVQEETKREESTMAKKAMAVHDILMRIVQVLSSESVDEVPHTLIATLNSAAELVQSAKNQMHELGFDEID